MFFIEEENLLLIKVHVVLLICQLLKDLDVIVDDRVHQTSETSIDEALVVIHSRVLHTCTPLDQLCNILVRPNRTVSEPNIQ